MIRTALHYHRPLTPAAASVILAEYAGNAAVLGGGTLLLPMLNRNELRVSHIVDLADLGLTDIAVTDTHVEIGARVTYYDVLRSVLLNGTAPLLQHVARGVTGGRQILQQATLVGSACLNSPTTEMPSVFAAMRARMRVHGPSGIREIAFDEFLLDANKVDLRPGEFVVSAAFERHTRSGYYKIKHSAGSWPIATASVLRDPGTTLFSVTLGAVEALPRRIEFDGAVPLERIVADAIASPRSDVLAPGSYRAAIAPVAARRAFSSFWD
jgi:carbon-monoxide dehydrogenase medium subunit